MNQRGFSYDSTVRRDADQYPAEEPYSSAGQPGGEPGRHCAYNATRSRFLSAEVDAADFSAASLDSRLSMVTPSSGAGLWLVPFRGISPTSVRVPVDLIYLDRNCKVIEAVESFPLARVSASCATSATVLVLPSETISATETQAGDQLIVCAPEEMKWRLQKLASDGAETKVEPAALAKEEPARGGTGRVLQWEDFARPRSAAEKAATETPAAEAAPVVEVEAEAEAEAEAAIAVAPEPAAAGLVATQASEPAPKPIKAQKTWLQKLLGVEPPDPRKAQRESLLGLSAYFFTGGTPVAHEVRDISLTGMYVFTSERWYPGTMVRMTLTDRHEPTVERSITLHATVMRWGNDGVGLRFVLQSSKDKRNRPSECTAESADIYQVDEFLQKLRSANG